MGESVDVLGDLRAEFRRKEQWLDLVVLIEKWRPEVDSQTAAELDGELLSVLEYMSQSSNPEWIRFAENRLENLYRSRKDSDSLRGLAGLYLDRSERQSNDLQKYVSARRECARIFEVELGEPESALVVMLSALGSDVLCSPGVLEDLERLGNRTGAWSDIISAVEKVTSQMGDDPRLNGILVRLGSWAIQQIGDEVRGVEWLQEAHRRDPYDLHAIATLQALYQRRGLYSKMAEMLVARADASLDAGARLAAWLELAALAEGPLDDSSTAAEAYEQVLILQPTNSEAFQKLEAIYADRGAWEDLLLVLRGRERLVKSESERRQLKDRIAQVLSKSGAVDEALRRFRETHPDPRDLIQVLKREAETSSGGARTRLMTEIGHIYSKVLKDPLAAHHYYERALGEDSQIIDAAEPMADAYLEDEQWERALPLLESLVRGGRSGREPRWLHRRWVQIALCCERLDRKVPALQAYREAYELIPSDVRTLKGLGRLSFEAGQYDSCLRTLQTLMQKHRSELSPIEIVAMHYMSGVAYREIGNWERALPEFEQAVQLNPRHLDALRELVERYEKTSNWPKYVQFAEQRINLEREPLVRFRLFCRLGEVWASQLNRPDLAMTSYRGALDIDPGSIVVLRKLLDLYTKNSKFPLAVKVLERLIVHEKNDQRRAMLHYTAAVLHRDHVGNPKAALDHFEASLDDDPEQLKAFEAIDRLLTKARDWKELERAYRRMLKRIASDDPDDKKGLKILLWQGLAEIYRSRLGHVQSAIDAYNVLKQMTPHDDKVPAILAELYSKSGDSSGAEDVHRKLLIDDPMRVESYSALFEIYMRAERFDAAWCMAAALSFMRVSLPNEEQFYQQYLGKNLKLGSGVLTQEQLINLVHPDHDVLTSSILSYVAETLRPIYCTLLKQTDIHPKKHLLSPDTPGVFRKLYDYVGKTLGAISLPELYARETWKGLSNLNLEFPAIGVGEDRVHSKNDRENAFYCAKLLYAMRPENYLATVSMFPPEAIHTMFCAALESCDPSFGFSKQVHDPNFDRAVKDLRKLPDHIRAPLRTLVQRFKTHKASVDIVKWLRGVDHTSSRIGLVLCGDLGLVASSLKYGPMRFGNANDEERLRELTKFAVSEEYFMLRHHLGLAISPHRGMPWV